MNMSQPNISQQETPRDVWRKRVEVYLAAGNSEDAAVRLADWMEEEENKRFDVYGWRLEQ